VFSADLAAALKLTDLSATLALAFDLRGLRSADRLAYRDAVLNLGELLEGGTAAGVSIRIGEECVLRAAVLCDREAEAAALKTRAYAALVGVARAFAREREKRLLAGNLLRKVQFAAEGRIATASATLTPWTASHLFPGP
jgi:hypothetical protein